MAKINKTPGVYIEEISAFPNSIAQVETAIPAFVGYTEKATYNNQEVTLKPTRLSSFGEFLRYFGDAPKTTYSIENVRQQDPNKPLRLSTTEQLVCSVYCAPLTPSSRNRCLPIMTITEHNLRVTNEPPG